jgi:hypothetical protein
VDATSFQGKGFDACTAPSASAMDTWKSASPYGAVGVYIGGVNRSCAQANLSATWGKARYDDHWRFIPLYVSLQVSNKTCHNCDLITEPAPQGAAAARDVFDQATARAAPRLRRRRGPSSPPPARPRSRTALPRRCPRSWPTRTARPSASRARAGLWREAGSQEIIDCSIRFETL